MDHAEPLEHFARCAEAFCAWARGGPPGPAREPARLLAELYAAALALPEVEPGDGPDEPRAAYQPEPIQARLGPHDDYWEVFDPFEFADPVATTLSDDLADIRRDLEPGLALWSAGARQAAAWHWRTNFHIHWGDHAVDALRALHRLVTRAEAEG